MNRVLFAALVFLVAATVVAQEQKQSIDHIDQIMAPYIEAGRPVREHDRLAALAGTWAVTTKMWMGPGEPITGSGTATAKMVLGGRFLQVNASTRKPLESEGLTVFGFDRRTSEYTMTGFDTMGTYSIAAAGRYDEAEKGVVLHGTYAQPPSGQEQKYRFVWTTPAANKHLITLFFALPDGKEMLVAEMSYTEAR